MRSCLALAALGPSVARLAPSAERSRVGACPMRASSYFRIPTLRVGRSSSLLPSAAQVSFSNPRTLTTKTTPATTTALRVRSTLQPGPKTQNQETKIYDPGPRTWTPEP